MIPMHPLPVAGAGNASAKITVPLESLMSTSWDCQGREQTVAQCKWNNITVHPCHQITELTCGNCYKKFRESEGIIWTPGYPVVFLYDLTCEWQIEVQEAHTIDLFIETLNVLEILDESTLECASEKPYIELLYGTQDRFSFYRYCNFKQLRSLSIPFNTLKIRYFSGVYNPKALHIQDTKQGLAISFKAVPVPPHRSVWWNISLVVIVVFVIIYSGASFYYWRFISPKNNQIQLKDMVIQQIVPSNTLDKKEQDGVYIFQRCQIKNENNLKSGLRQRSNGSASPLPNVFYPDSAGKGTIGTAIRNLCSRSSTPLTILPETIPKDQYYNNGKNLIISKCKANLTDRFARKSSNRYSDSSVFLSLEAEPNFNIYHSESSDTREKSEM